MNRSFLISVASSVLLLALVGPLQAQQKPNAAKAEKEYNVGKRAEELGNLRLAAIHYKRAYDLYPTPTLLYTLAHTHRLLGDREIALDYYKRYVVADPGGPRVNAANKYIKILSEALGDKGGGEPSEPDGGGKTGGDTGGKTGGGDTTPDPGGDDGDSDDDNVALDPDLDEPGGGPGRDDQRDHTLRWVGVGVGVVGLASLATGIAYGLKAQSLTNDINNPGIEWDADELAKFEEGEAAERNQIIFTAGGGALVLTGIILVVVDAIGGDGGDGDGDGAVATPVIGPDHLGLAVGGRF